MPDGINITVILVILTVVVIIYYHHLILNVYKIFSVLRWGTEHESRVVEEYAMMMPPQEPPHTLSLLTSPRLPALTLLQPQVGLSMVTSCTYVFTLYSSAHCVAQLKLNYQSTVTQIKILVGTALKASKLLICLQPR